MRIFFKEEKFFYGVVEIFFQVSFISFLLLFIADYIFPGFVTNWFNPIWLLIFSIICTIILFTKD